MGDFQPTPTTEEYLETIWELEEAGIPPMRARIVERLGVSAPTVSETVARLEREGYLSLGPDRRMVLSDRGRAYATTMVRRHRLAERLLVDVLRVPWHQVHEEAGRLEHAISERLEQHLVQLLGDPGTCPHGNGIPGSANALPPVSTVRLLDAPAGARLRVRNIDEELESHADLLLLLEEHLLMPDCTAEAQGREGEDVVVLTRSGVTRLPARVAAGVFVVVESATEEPSGAAH